MEIKFDKKNYRKHSEQNKKRIKKSLKECGAGRSVLVDADDTLIAGNGVFEQAQAMGIPTRVIETDGTELVVVKRTDLRTDDDKRKLLAMADNATSDNVEWDTEMLNDDFEVEGLSDWGIDVDLSVEQEPQEAKEDDFDEEKDKVDTVCKDGDVWQLGEHRLMCGDSTKAQNFDRLMDGQKADICFTSPPYNGNTDMPQQSMKKGNTVTSQKLYNKGYSDNLSSSQYIEFCKRVLDICFCNTNGFIFWNVNYNANSRFEYIAQIVDKLPNLIEQICWKKQTSIPFKGSLKRIWEPIYLFSTNGNKLKLKQCTDNFWEISNHSANNADHNACFPVQLPYKAINITQSKIVLDPFGGTGTTLIAAEQLGRKCYMMELDPHYCDVIIARWEKLTGKKAVKL